MKRRGILNLVIVSCVVAVACVDLSAPRGPAAISPLLLPSTFVVRGDSLRDSAGNVAGPRLIQYDQGGRATIAAGASFFITDTIPPARLFHDTLIVGDTFGFAHVVGQIGNVQTAAFALPVTVAPVAIQPLAGSDTDTIKVTISSDSGTSRATLPILLRVSGGSNAPSPTGIDTAVQGVWVHYSALTLDSSVVRLSQDPVLHPAVFIVNKAGDKSLIDTTSMDANGQTSNQIVVIGSFLSRTLLSDSAFTAGLKADSVVITASVTYKGQPLLNSPFRLVVPLKVTFGIK